ncbi:MAG: aa3-type cytochrome c oxidase subunit IV [Pseudomonadota bacterium]
MASADYTRGEMNISEQARTWDGFIKASVWGSAIIFLAVAYATLAVAMGVNWFVALILCAGAGIVGGVLMNMGGAWIATVVGLSGVAVVIQLIITLAKALLPG